MRGVVAKRLRREERLGVPTTYRQKVHKRFEVRLVNGLPGRFQVDRITISMDHNCDRARYQRAKRAHSRRAAQ